MKLLYDASIWHRISRVKRIDHSIRLTLYLAGLLHLIQPVDYEIVWLQHCTLTRQCRQPTRCWGVYLCFALGVTFLALTGNP